ncbi:hypothetical protein HELRODRAFT_190320 [Helobdella robusta]|uniref:Galactose-1-phosphate uridylyltransferase n=1 Tax=Helobdella robusta TaxID=6412 RepID=T1FRW7_HELRO|nr:hypothetical protein HELRODRAFT_190320 [Helobdella robusta]ESO09895.1 hypothetical protein HELRODRAFT_190320 [Helobdella robusta]
MCFHPDSTVTLATMTCSEIAAVIKKLAELCLELQQKYEWIQVFENKGAIMGCSNPHPHCQIWASSFLPTEPSKKDEMQKEYFKKHKRILLMDYTKRELNYQVRVVVESEKWACLVPFWAVWPFETYLIPKRHCLRLQNLDDEEIEDLASMLKKLLCKYDNLFQTSFPYSMGWHGAPSGKYLNKKNDDGEDACFYWQLHATFLPPLLRSSTVKKFMVGYEMLAEAQRDLTPEKAADILRNLSTIHYKDQ